MSPLPQCRHLPNVNVIHLASDLGQARQSMFVQYLSRQLTSVGALICPGQQDLQERNVAWIGLPPLSPNFNKDATIILDMEQFVWLL